MPSCAVFNCTSGYESNKEKVQLIPFPTNATQKRWIEAINRENFVVTSNSRVCEKHFKETDWIPSELNTTSRGKPKKKKALKPNVVPSLYLKGGAPKLESPTKNVQRTQHDHSYGLGPSSKTPKVSKDISKAPRHSNADVPASSEVEVTSGKSEF